MFFCAVFIASAAAVTVFALPPDIARIKNSKKIVVALIAEDSPPFFYQDGPRNLKGIDIEIARLIGSRLGVAVVFDRSPQTFDEVLDFVARGKADIAISALYPSLERAQKVVFTRPYYRITPVLIVNRLAAAPLGVLPSMEAFNNPKTSIGFYNAAMFPGLVHRNFPSARLAAYKNDGKRNVLISDLTQGKLAAIYTDEIEEKKWRKEIKNFDLYFRVIKDPKTRISVSIAARWQDTHLAYWLNSFLTTLREALGDRSLDDIVGRNLGDLLGWNANTQ